MTTKRAYPKDGFSAPLSVADRMAKARAARSVDSDNAADRGGENVAGICTDPGQRPSRTMKIGNSPLRAIRAQCYDCVCGSAKEIELCPAVECPLYPFRFGKRPATVAKKRNAAREESEAA